MSGVNCWCGHYWHCGDCGAGYPKNVLYCTRPFDDYLSLRGGTVESAIKKAVDEGMNPVLNKWLKPELTRRYPTDYRFAIAA